MGTSITVQQKLMRHSDIRTTLNIYGDVVTDEMEQADSKVAALASVVTLKPANEGQGKTGQRKRPGTKLF